MYKKSIDLLKEKKIVFENGLTFEEVVQIEKAYEIIFPKSLRDFLMTALPVSKGFYNWRSREQKNVEYIKNMINEPIRYINDMPEEIKKRLRTAPKLIPVFSHRYMPMIPNENPPIISVHGLDIIYYGEDIQDYFNIEFGEKKQNTINFENINPIPFWTDIM